MYPFATIVLLGLAVAAVVGFIHNLGLARRSVEVSLAVRLILALALGVLLTWALNYTMFAAWAIGFRASWMGPVATGLVVGGAAAFWDQLITLISSSTRQRSDRASSESETRMPRAA